MSRINNIKYKEVETAISFYQKIGYSKDEIYRIISDNFAISKEEIKKIAMNNNKTA